MAIGHGRTAAGHVDARLRGARLAPEPDAVPIPFAGLNTWYYSDSPRSIRPQLELARRRSTFDEVTGGLDASKGCEICVQECPAGAIAMEPEEV
jgi:ferredoxin